MMYAYQLNYGTHNTHLIHTHKISKKEFEGMVIEAALEAAKKSFPTTDEEMHNKKVTAAQIAMMNRLNGDEYMYDIAMSECIEPRATSLFRYEGLHDDVVYIMIEKFGFIKLKNTHSLSFDTGVNLAHENTSKNPRLSAITRKLSKQIRLKIHDSKYKNHYDMCIAIHNKRMALGSTARDAEDMALVESLGVQYVPYDNPTAIEARRKLENQ